MQLVILVAVFLSVAGVLVGAYIFFNRRGLEAAATVRERMQTSEAVETRSILKDTRASQLPFLDRLLQGRRPTDAIQDRLESAGSAQKPAVFFLATALSAAAGIAIAVSFGGIIGFGLLVFGIAAPWIWLRVRMKRRLATFEQKFPDALDMMSNAMRAGYSFQAATHFIGEEMQPPVGPEFARFYDEQRLGIDVRTALLGMQGRVDSLNVKMFVTAVLIQRETGGNLTELLGHLSTLMRERVASQGQLETLTAEPKMSARFLALLPLFLYLGLSYANPSFMNPFSQSHLGHVMLTTAAISVVFGYMMLMKIADIDM